MTIGLINTFSFMFSMTTKNGLTLPITSTCCPATAVPAFKEQGVICKFYCFANFSEQMVPKRFPLSTRVLIKVFPINMPV